MLRCFTTGILLMSQVASAALPPTAESLRRFKAITESKEVYDTLGSVNWIKAITESSDSYIIQTEKCTLSVVVESVIDAHPKLVGPAQLKVKVGKLECK